MTTFNHSEAFAAANAHDMASVDCSKASCNGAGWSSILAAGIGCAGFGLFVILAESSKRIAEAFKFSQRVGPLSGKSTVGVVAWLLAWGVLHLFWRKRDINSGKILALTLILVLLGLLGTFPPFYKLFVPH